MQGASILRMLEDWMGKDKFRDGCRVSHSRYLTDGRISFHPCSSQFERIFIFFPQKYLKDYYFDNAKTANFWKSLADVCLIFININLSRPD